MIVRSNQPIKIEKPLQCSHCFLAALVKESRSYFFNAQIIAENTENNEEFVHCQSYYLEEDDLQMLEVDSVPENTKKQTSWLEAAIFRHVREAYLTARGQTLDLHGLNREDET